jgi:hypothetical protein
MTAGRVGGGARALLLAAAAAAVIVVCAAVLVPAAARASELESSDMKYAPRPRERERGREGGRGGEVVARRNSLVCAMSMVCIDDGTRLSHR